MTLRYVAEIRDPVHGYIRITQVERAVIDSPFVQRLRRIHQLAGAYMVYPGGVHSRFEHVLGTMHVAGLIAESIADKVDLDEGQIQELRLAALLHDVGHGPFSHLFEEVLTEKTGLTHEDMSQRIVIESDIKGILEKQGISSKEMSQLCVGKKKAQPFMNEVIAGGLSADIMDYLLRDSYFTGVEYGKVDIHRVIDSLDVMDGHMVLDQAALYAFEALLIARYEMFKAVYFHRTVRAAELMLAHSMALADEELGLTDLSRIDNYLKLTDEVVVYRLTSLRLKNQKLRLARELAENYNNRRLVKCVFERVMQRKDRVVEKIFSQKRFRNELIGEIAKKAKRRGDERLRRRPDDPLGAPHIHEGGPELHHAGLRTTSAESTARGSRSRSSLWSGRSRASPTCCGSTPSRSRGTRSRRAVQTIFGREDFTSRVSL